MQVADSTRFWPETFTSITVDLGLLLLPLFALMIVESRRLAMVTVWTLAR